MEQIYYFDNSEFYIKNINVLLDLRKRYEINFNDTHDFVIDNNELRNDTEDDKLNMEYQRAINSSITFNCFALFESVFEKNLIDYYVKNKYNEEVNYEELIGNRNAGDEIIKKDLKKISEIIRISGYEKYKNEYKSLTGKNIGQLFVNKNESDAYDVFIKLFPLRSYLVHGSNYILRGTESNLKLFLKDCDDPDYHKMITFINNKLQLALTNDVTFDSLITRNEVVDFILKSLYVIVKVFNPNPKSLLIDIIFNPH